MAARTIRLADLNPEPTVVELGEHSYTLRSVTRSVQKKLETALKELNAAENDTDGDKSIAAMVNAMDVLLAPSADAPAAKKVLTDAWKADTLSVDAIGRLFDSISESAARPT